jgi:hypothetical protein
MTGQTLLFSQGEPGCGSLHVDVWLNQFAWTIHVLCSLLTAWRREVIGVGVKVGDLCKEGLGLIEQVMVDLRFESAKRDRGKIEAGKGESFLH